MRRTSFRTTNKFILLQYFVPSLLPTKSSYFYCRCHCWQWCLAIGRNALRFERLRRGLWLRCLLQYFCPAHKLDFNSQFYGPAHNAMAIKSNHVIVLSHSIIYASSLLSFYKVGFIQSHFFGIFFYISTIQIKSVM